MADPFAAGHQAKAIAEAKEAEAKAQQVVIDRATAKGEAAKAKPVEQAPYVPSKPPWSRSDV